MISRRSFVGGASTAAFVGPAAVRAQSYPSRPVTIIVPSPPAGTTDFTARLVGEYLSQLLGQQFVVENVGGASGNLGNARVARAEPDGYTLLLSYSGYHVANPHLFRRINWDPLKSFTPIGLAVTAPHVVLAAKKLPVSDLRSFIAYAKANPGKLNYASSGIGSIQHIGAEQLKSTTGIEMTHVPYRGAGPAMNDLVGGSVDLFITTPPSAVGHIRAGNVTGLALAAAERHPILGELPTAAEAGLPGYELVAWFALYGPAGISQAVQERLAQALETVVKKPEFRSRVEQQGAYATFMGATELATFTERELAYWGRIIKRAGISVE